VSINQAEVIMKDQPIKKKDRPRTQPYSFRLTDKDHNTVLALADKKKWTKSDALREMIKTYSK
tara:strand:- start:407 stop:595 length:189 start_codon:yes stop_codon:yes gene_type:complete